MSITVNVSFFERIAPELRAHSHFDCPDRHCLSIDCRESHVSMWMTVENLERLRATIDAYLEALRGLPRRDPLQPAATVDA